MSVPFTPSGYHSITPYLIARDAAAAIAFYQKAFGAEEVVRLSMPDGSIAHAEIKIGDSLVMLGEESPAWGTQSPLALNGTPAGLMIYVPDADAAFTQAVAAGATVDRPVEDQFWGDRTGSVYDPFGHKWTLSTHIEDVSPEEMKRRMEAWVASMDQEQKQAA
ncbi:MAG: VOC family protein [Fimbriiglobus sp.]|jgi:PhnB protein|nr:VOC family protein [Fimbriiglobus sp.]